MGQALEIIFQAFGGLGIFLLGMKYMSEGMQAVAGERLRKLIGSITNNRVMATGVGALVTCVIQSSSITTVMVVGMVSAGIMTLLQAIGVILGANIGTTITGWILVINIGKYGLPLLGFSMFFYLFSKRDNVRFSFMFLVGLGMVFFGLQLMTQGLAPIRTMPAFEAWFHRFQPDTYWGIWKCVLVGAGLTAVVQSSSATLGITIALALTGAINYGAAAALILGENIGTTITAFLASLGASTNARRAAYAHVLFNCIGVLWITLLFPFYTKIVTGVITTTQGCDIPAIMATAPITDETRDYLGKCKLTDSVVYVQDEAGQWVNAAGDVLAPDEKHVLAEDFNKAMASGSIADLPVYAKNEVTYPFTSSAIALTHSGFNILNTLLFLPFIGFLARFLLWLVPDKKVSEKPHLTYLNVRMLDTPAIGIQQSYKELIKMSRICQDMLRKWKTFLSNEEPNKPLSEEIFQQENDLDVMQKEVVEFIGEIMTGSISHEVMQDANGQVRIADELESISDYIQGLLKLRLKIRETHQQFSEKGLEDMVRLHEKVDRYLALIADGIEREDNSPEYFGEMRTKGLAVTTLMKECRNNHLQRVNDGIVNPLMSLIYTDMLTSYRRIKDHAFNIAEVLAGEK